MSMTVSVRIEHRAGDRAAGQARHDTRAGKVPGYVDREKSDRNSVLIQPRTPGDLRSLCEERRAGRETKRRMKTDAAVASVGIITFGTDAQRTIDAMSPDQQDRLFLETAGRVAMRLGTTVSGLVVHRDEAAIHCHFQMPAVALDGRPVSKTMTPNVAVELQDIAGSVYEPFGINRGTPRAERRARGEPTAKWVHMTTREIHDKIPQDLEDARARVAEAEEKARKATERLAKVEEKLRDGVKADADLDKRLETKTRRAAAADKALVTARAELKRLEDIAAAIPPIKPVVITQAVPVKDDRSAFQRMVGVPAPAPTLRKVKVYPTTVGKDVEAARARQARATEKAKEAEAREQALLERMHRVSRAWGLASIDQPTSSAFLAALETGKAVHVQAYGVTLVKTPDVVLVPPQDASARQKAAALYTETKMWDRVRFFGIDDRTAQEIASMAIADDRKVLFADKGQQDRYEKAAALAAIEPVPEASEDEAAAAAAKPKPG